MKGIRREAQTLRKEIETEINEVQKEDPYTPYRGIRLGNDFLLGEIERISGCKLNFDVGSLSPSLLNRVLIKTLANYRSYVKVTASNGTQGWITKEKLNNLKKEGEPYPLRPWFIDWRNECEILHRSAGSAIYDLQKEFWRQNLRELGKPLRNGGGGRSIYNYPYLVGGNIVDNGYDDTTHTVNFGSLQNLNHTGKYCRAWVALVDAAPADELPAAGHYPDRCWQKLGSPAVLKIASMMEPERAPLLADLIFRKVGEPELILHNYRGGIHWAEEINEVFYRKEKQFASLLDRGKYFEAVRLMDFYRVVRYLCPQRVFDGLPLQSQWTSYESVGCIKPSLLDKFCGQSSLTHKKWQFLEGVLRIVAFTEIGEVWKTGCNGKSYSSPRLQWKLRNATTSPWKKFSALVALKFATDSVTLFSEHFLLRLWVHSSWKEHFNRVPKNGWVKCFVPIEAIQPLRETKGAFSAFMKIVKPRLSSIGAEDKHFVQAAVRLALSFPEEAKVMTESKSKEEIHDMGINLPDRPLSKEEKAFISTHGFTMDALRVVKAWGWLQKEEGISSLAQPLATLLAALDKAEVYEGIDVQDIELARFARKFGVDEEDYLGLEEKWCNYKGWTVETIPGIGTLEKDGYKMYRLDKSDPRTLFAGALTDCCQHPGGAGSSCAWHAYSNPDGCVFVIEKHGKIICQSWVWRKGSVVCFDNCEALSGYHGSVTLQELYKEAAQRLLDSGFGIGKVLVGSGGDDLCWRESLGETSSCKLAPEGCYTDADSVWALAGGAQ